MIMNDDDEKSLCDQHGSNNYMYVLYNITEGMTYTHVFFTWFIGSSGLLPNTDHYSALRGPGKFDKHINTSWFMIHDIYGNKIL